MLPDAGSESFLLYDPWPSGCTVISHQPLIWLFHSLQNQVSFCLIPDGLVYPGEIKIADKIRGEEIELI